MTLDDETLYQLSKHEDDIDCAGAAAEIRELRVECSRARKEIERLALLVLESVELETFWKRCAEQALRLWENSQDMRDELCSVIGLCSTIEQVHELLHDELNA